MSSSYQKLPIEDLKVADSVQNGNVEEQKLPIKLFRDAFLQACTNKNYNEPTIDNMKRVYDNLEVNQVFSV
jgi:ATP-dependent DNA helicase RecG